MMEVENQELSTDPEEESAMEVDNKEESKPDKGGGGDRHSDTSDSDAEDKDTKDNDEGKKLDNKEEKKSETPKKTEKQSNKTPKKPKKAESDDDGSDADGEEDKVALLERPVVITGKRERKKVERIDVSSGATPKEKKLEVPEGKGTALGEIPNIEFKFGKTLADDLKPLHRFIYGRAGTASEIKKNLRKFCGFDFKKDSPEYTKKSGMLNKMTLPQVKSMCEVLDQERSGTKETIVTRLMEFFLKPTSSGKKLLADKKRKRSSSGKGKKGKTKKRGKKGDKKEKKKKPKKKVTSKDSEIEDSDSDDEESEDGDDESDEEKPKKKAKAPAKKKPQKKKDSDDEDEESEKDEDDEDDDDEDESEDEQPKKKKAKLESKKEAKKPEKKASPQKTDSDNSGTESDDEPLVKPKSPKPPSDDELKEVIKKILDGANLEEVTMKTVCKQVYAKYEQFDLTDRKDFIKSTVKELVQQITKEPFQRR